jgi:sortase A
MNKVIYKKKPRRNKRFIRATGFFMLTIGMLGLLYIVFPLLSWQFYFAAFASESVISPVPATESADNVVSLLSSSTNQLKGIDYTQAQNWYPTIQTPQTPSQVTSYSISIPKIQVEDAIVSTGDMDLSRHMVQYNSKATPPETGNAVVFGHSTLPQLYNSHDYKTILAKAYMLQKGDSIIATVGGVSYLYKIITVRVVSAEDMSVFAPKTDDSYLTLVTCTPPGTIWKRLVLQSRLQSL